MTKENAVTFPDSPADSPSALVAVLDAPAGNDVPAGKAVSTAARSFRGGRLAGATGHGISNGAGKTAALGTRRLRAATAPAPVRRFNATSVDEQGYNRQAELFYLQKQIQLQTQMVFILEDGSRVQGVVEWYDRHSIKVRGKLRTLIYKAAIKYLYKAGENGDE